MDTFPLGLVDGAIALGALVLFAGAYLAARLATRPARVAAAPAAPDLGDEPPAVVSLLANRWRFTEDASESTLLDLAARGYLELRQPGDDPRHTTIHLRQPAQPEQPEQLLPYERRVLHRIQDLAVDGVVPVTALTFRDKQRARRWNKRLRQEVVADARRRGLSRRRLSRTWMLVLGAAAATGATGVAVAVTRVAIRDNGDLLSGVWVGVMTLALLAAVAATLPGERDTGAGRRVAARWLGVRDWLRGHEAFADLPPAAVAVWDRYLSYGAALGVTHTASEVLDLGLGDRRLVWSSYGGAWRRVRVRYPRLLPRYGKAAPALLVGATVAALAGGLLWWRFGPPQLSIPEPPADPNPQTVVEFAGEIVALLAAVLLAYGGYVLARTLLDLATTRTITGEVLWRELWRSRSRGRNNRSVPWLDYLAVDDGRSERTTAWALPRKLAPAVQDRDEVTIRVRPWTRRIVSLTVVAQGRSRRLRDAAADEPEREPAVEGVFGVLRQAAGGLATALGIPGREAEQLLTADEVSQALGTAVTGPLRMPTPGPMASVRFTTADRGTDVLTVGLASGRLARWLSDRAPGYPAVPAAGDVAYLEGDRAVARVGESAVVLAVVGDGQSARDRLPELLRLAAARVEGRPDAAARA